MKLIIDSFIAFFTNYLLVSAILGWLVAQILKIITESFKAKRFKPVGMFASGGMPSSHSAAVCALTMSSAIEFGFGSSQFAITALLAMIVMRDASGVRRETGEQAKVINQIVKTLLMGESKDINGDLKEIVGHTPFQVFMGALVGVAVAFCLMPLMK